MDSRANTDRVWQERRSPNNRGRRASDQVAQAADRRTSAADRASAETPERRLPDVVMPDSADAHDYAWNRD